MTVASPAPPVLELAGIGKRYGGVQALTGVDLALGPGEVHGLVGENGSGKSTLIKIIAGVVAPDPGGTIRIAGAAVPGLTAHESTRAGIQVIYQDLSLFPNLTVAENIGFARHLERPLGLADRAAIRARAAAALARIGVRLDLDRLVAALSIADRQLVAIARALAAEARLVIMDEPTASLTHQEVEALLRVVRELQAQGIAILFVSHRLNEVMAIAERVTVLRDGAKVGCFPAGALDHDRLAELMTGSAFHYQPMVGPAAAPPPMLAVDRLTRRGQYEDVSLTVGAGEIVGLIGLLGAGRTELALSLFGMNPPDAGQVMLDGAPLPLARNRDALARGVAYVSEDRLNLGLVLDQPIADNLILAVLPRLAGRFGLIDGAKRTTLVQRWLRGLAIKSGDPAAPVRTLSGGNQQRIVLAKWMATQPKLLILDTPTAGVDIAAKSGIYDIVKRLAEDGLAVLMISDEVPEVLYHSHRILVMRRGRIVAERRPDQTSADELEQLIDA